MNIGIVTTWFERGAAYVSRQFRDILKQSNNIYIYARDGEKYAIDDSIWDSKDVTWGKKAEISGPSILDLNDFEKWIKKNKLEIIFFNEQRWWEPVLVAKKRGIKTGAYVDYYTEETIPLFECYDFLICNTERHYNIFKWHPQSYFVKWGTDISLFKPKNYNAINRECITFFHSCGYSPRRKGTDQVLQAFLQLDSNAHLVIHSQINLKEYYPEYKSQLDKLQEEGKLSLYTETVTAPGLYRLGDVYIYPSRLDGIGLTIAEALASGLSVITSNNPPMNEFIDCTNGKLVKTSKFYSRADGYYWPQCDIDKDDLVAKMKFYVDNFDRIAEFKLNARKYAEEFLDWNKNATQLVNYFEKSMKLDLNKSIEIKIKKYDSRNEGLDVERILNKINKINKLFDNIEQQQKIVIYGAGKHTEQLLKLTNLRNKKIVSIVDQKYMEKQCLFDISINSPDIINELKPNLIIISSFEYQETINSYLRNILSYRGQIIKLYNNETDFKPFYL